MSISAVARHAELSVSTVSRFLRGELRVSARTEERIRAAMEATGYRARPQPGRTVALIVPELSNPYFSQLAQEFADVAAARDVEVQILVSGGHQSRERSLLSKAVASSEVSAVVFVSMSGSAEVLETVPRNTPLVVFDERMEDDAGATRPFAGADNLGGAYQATAYLLSNGHRRIAHLGGPGALDSARQRLRGYRQALQDHGLAVDPHLVFEGPYSEAFGASVLPRLLRLKDRPTAVFAGSDIMAVGLAAAAPMHGVSIPADLSLIGFDGIEVGSWITPRLSTVVQPYEQLAQRALDHVEAAWTGRAVNPGLLPMQVRIAESVGRPPAEG